MEKLIELLNECTNSRFKSEDDLRLCIEMRWYCRDFVKWLVENDKIDRDKKEIEKSDYDITFTWALTMDKKSDLDIMVDTLLMLLINIRYTYWRPYFIS